MALPKREAVSLLDGEGGHPGAGYVGDLFRVIPASLVILFAVSVTKVKCILRSKVLLQRQVKYITGSEKMK